MRTTRATSRRRGFTLVELLVVIGIISILTGLLLPAIIHALSRGDLVNCISSLRQIGQAFTTYIKDFDSWMVSCGAPSTLLNTAPNNGPFKEPPMDYLTAKGIVDGGKFPFWYTALAPYVNPSATWQNAVTSYTLREGKAPPDDTAIYTEQAKLCMLYSCPGKREATLAYGYNYAAPFGESILYPFDKVKYAADYPSSACRDGLTGSKAQKDLSQDQFCWPYSTGGGTEPQGFMPYPCFMGSQPAPLPILWYGQSVHFGTLTQPTAQIAVCDTGLVTNDPVWAYSGTPSLWRPTEERYPPEQWTEHTRGLAADCSAGYVRFPLSKLYTGEDLSWDGWLTKRILWYKGFYCRYTPSASGTTYPQYNNAWRPVPRHNKQTVCLYFDGRAMKHNIMDIVSYEWGDRKCLFDNLPGGKAPVPRAADDYNLNVWLPYRKGDGTVDATK